MPGLFSVRKIQKRKTLFNLLLRQITKNINMQLLVYTCGNPNNIAAFALSANGSDAFVTPRIDAPCSFVLKPRMLPTPTLFSAHRWHLFSLAAAVLQDLKKEGRNMVSLAFKGLHFAAVMQMSYYLYSGLGWLNLQPASHLVL